MSDFMLDGVRKLVEPYGLKCCAVNRADGLPTIRVFAQLEGTRGIFLSKSFQRRVHIFRAIKTWLGADLTKAKLATLRATTTLTTLPA